MVFSSSAAHSQPVSGGLRLEDAVRLAVTQNERGRISDLNVVVAEASVERARSAFLPVINATGNDTLHPAIGTAQATHAATGAVVLTQPIVNASAYPLYAQARALANAQHAQNVDDKRLLEFSAATSFLAVLSAQSLLEAARHQLESARSNQAYAQARVDAQLASTNDVTRAQIDAASSEREVLADTGTLQNAYLQLGFVLNAAVGPPLAPPEATLAAAEQAPVNADTLVHLALERRPDVLVSRYMDAAAHHFASEPLLRLVPTVAVSATLSGTTNTPLSTHEWYDESVAANLTWPIFDTGVRYADKHARDAQADIADLTLRQLVRNVDAQVRGAQALLASTQSAFRVASEAMAAAQRNVDEAAILYRQGLAKAIELVDANDQRFTAEINDANAQIAMAQAYLNLRQALGLDATGTELK